MDKEAKESSIMEDFNEKIFTVYGFGLVFVVIGIFLFMFGVPRTSTGGWGTLWLSTHSYILNPPGYALLVFSVAGALFLFSGSRMENKPLE
jgi:hypothetical protein